MARMFRALTALILVALLFSACGPAAPAPTKVPVATEASAATEAPTVVAQPPSPTQASTVAPTTPPQPQAGGDLMMGLNAEPATLDPATAFMEQEATVMRQIYDTLVYVDADHQLHAGLATSWEQSPDAQVFTLKLRKGVMFHDSTPFNAQAVKYNFDRFGNPEVGTGSNSTYFSDYVSTEVVDDYTVRVTFGAPHPLFLLALGYGMTGIASPTAVEAGGADYGKKPVGTGPFMFKDWVPGERITLTANPDYNWAPDIFQHQGPPHLSTVTFLVVTEDTTRIAMLQSGEANVVEQFPAQDITWLSTDPNYYLVSGAAPGLPTIMMINVERPPTDDLAVRQALIYSVDQESLVSAGFFDTQQPAHGVLAPSTLDYDQVAADMYRYDPAKAAALLEEAGWVDTNGDGVREKDGNELSIYYPAYRVWENAYMELLQNMWAAVGFHVDLEQLEDAAAWDAAAAGEHNVTNMGAIGFDASVLLPAFQSSNIAEGYAFTRYADPELDTTLSNAAVEVDPQMRADLYAQAQRKIMQEALVVPIYAFTRILAVRSEFAGVTLDWQNWYPYFYDVAVQQ
jgi:peptide/nickel transport system substrate-binding protein